MIRGMMRRLTKTRPLVGHRKVTTAMLNGSFRVHPIVDIALSEGKPVVALESTIVAHGMPYPQNLEVAREVEAILKNKGVVPATIAIKNGICRIGLEPDELNDLAQAGEQGRAKKCSTRDLPIGMAFSQSDSSGHQWGATTVASTMKLANLAGISTFVTGGIGGVHRNGEISMDVSADLTELGRTPVVVVSAGIKSILDIERTMEVLETNSVPTFGWRTDEFPAFFSPHSGVPCPSRVDSAEGVATAFWASRALNLSQGMLVAVPNHDAAGENVETAIQQALAEAEEKQITGQAVTPFVLKTVAEMTGGDSLKSNIALIKHNAVVGAEIAKAIALKKSSTKVRASSPYAQNKNLPDPIFLHEKCSQNVAFLNRFHELRMSPLSPDHPAPDLILDHAQYLVMRGGTEIVRQTELVKKATTFEVDIVFIPKSVDSALAAFRDSEFLRSTQFAILAVEEVLALSDGWTEDAEDTEFALLENELDTIKEAATRALKRMRGKDAHLLIMLEHKGLLVASRHGEDPIQFEQFQKEKVEVRRGTATCDSFCGAFLHQLIERGRNCARLGRRCIPSSGLTTIRWKIHVSTPLAIRSKRLTTTVDES